MSGVKICWYDYNVLCTINCQSSSLISYGLNKIYFIFSIYQFMIKFNLRWIFQKTKLQKHVHFILECICIAFYLYLHNQFHLHFVYSWVPRKPERLFVWKKVVYFFGTKNLRQEQLEMFFRNEEEFVLTQNWGFVLISDRCDNGRVGYWKQQGKLPQARI